MGEPRAGSRRRSVRNSTARAGQSPRGEAGHRATTGRATFQRRRTQLRPSAGHRPARQPRPDGTPQTRPLGFLLNPDGTIDLGGPWVARTRRWRNIEAHPQVSFVGHLTPDGGPDAVKPGMGRGVEIRGRRSSSQAVDRHRGRARPAASATYALP
uniref:Pyridoxamine 5'-phosphate oxidase family protein n=1 Tax=Streptomyces sp. NBC_01401 TaxID=2903854 RepID=A0AAU3H5I8_9ACTN